jgi:hypothetical protein
VPRSTNRAHGRSLRAKNLWETCDETAYLPYTSSSVSARCAPRLSASCLNVLTAIMELFGPKSFEEVSELFSQENRFKDEKVCKAGDTWARDRFKEADAHFLGEWYEYRLSHAEILDIKLPWHKYTYQTPEDGVTVAEALQIPSVQKWIAGEAPNYPESHILLAAGAFKTDAIEYRLMKNHKGRIVMLDGQHRLVTWAKAEKQSFLAFIAGKPVR